MIRRLPTLLASSLLTLTLLASACSGDDGASVRSLSDDGSTSASSGSGSGSASGSGSGSGSGAASGSASSSASAPSGDAAPTVGDGGYEYASNVDSHRLVPADLCPIGDLLDAGDFDAVETLYREGEHSVRSDAGVRSIGGFALRDDRSHGHDDFYGVATPLDDFVSAALEGTGDFAGESDAVRAQGAEKGIRNVVMIAWVVHELNTAIDKAMDGDFDVESGAVHNWDEGWAFYHGAEPGCAPHATANSRAGNFGTTGSGKTAQANEAILHAMIDGRDALLAEDADGAAEAASEVVRNVAITYSQATIRYAHLVELDLAAGDDAKAREHQAEGYAFWRVIEPYIVPAGADGDAINAVLGLTNEPGVNGGSAEVRAALAPGWEALGIDESEIGALESE